MFDKFEISPTVGALNSHLINQRRRSQYSPASTELSFDFNRRASYAIDALTADRASLTSANSGSNCDPFASHRSSTLVSPLEPTLMMMATCALDRTTASVASH